jgi:sarcosine oxidase subunit beta
VKADVVIIGGGLMGSCTALHLAMRGRRVIVVEKDSPGRHASGVNAGGLRQLNRHPAEIPLSVAAAEIWRNLRSLVDSDCDVKLAGQVRVAENPQDLERLEQRAALVRSLGYQHEQIIGRDQLYRLVPALAPHCVGALYSPGDGFARPFHALTAFRRKAESLGVVYRSGQQVTGLDQIGQHWRLVTQDDWFEGESLVNCAGAWAGQVCASLGEPVPLESGAPMMMVTERLPHFLDPVVGAASRKLSFKQMQNGTVLIGGAHLARHDLQQETTEIDFLKLRESSRTVIALFPRMRGVRIVRCWAGLEAFMPDHLPVIGRSGTAPRVFHAFGFSAHGFQLSPVVGRILSELILEGASALPIEPFSIRRFQGGGGPA